MSLSEFVTSLFSGSKGDESPSDTSSQPGEGTSQNGAVIYECRQCGTTVTPEAKTCPNCGDDDIVDYPIE